MFGLLVRLGASAAPFAYGWISSNFADWFTETNPVESESDGYAIGGWGLSILLLPFIVFFAWDKWGK